MARRECNHYEIQEDRFSREIKKGAFLTCFNRKTDNTRNHRENTKHKSRISGKRPATKDVYLKAQVLKKSYSTYYI